MSEATPTGETHRHVVMLLTVPDSLEHRLADIHALALSLQTDGATLNVIPDVISCDNAKEIANVRNMQAWKSWSRESQRRELPRRQSAHEAQVATKSAAGAAGQR